MSDEPEDLRRRSIRSFVVRAGRMGPGQSRALADLGVKTNYQDGLLSIDLARPEPERVVKTIAINEHE